MKIPVLSFRLFLFAFSLSLLSACGSEPQNKEGDQESTATPQNAQPAAAKKIDPNSLDEATRAKEACNCFEKLNNMRQKAKGQYAKGDTTAFTNIETEMRETRLAARTCARNLVAPIKEDAAKKKAFQDALSKTCPNYSTSVLLMTKLNFTPE